MFIPDSQSDSRLLSFRHRLAEKIGPRQFNRLVESAYETKRRQRLRAWQERLFEDWQSDLSADEKRFLDAFGGYEVFIYIFHNAERMDYEITRTEFLEDPETFFLDSKCRISDEWIGEAWKNAQFRDAVSSVFAFSISMVGTFDWADGVAESLTRVLTLSDATALYESIYSELHMPESEWREHFVNAFPIVEKSLPHLDDAHE